MLHAAAPLRAPLTPRMRVIEAITPLLIESRLFTDPNIPPGGREKERNKRKRNKTHMGLKIGQGGTLDPLADGVLGGCEEGSADDTVSGADTSHRRWPWYQAPQQIPRVLQGASYLV